MAAKKRSKLLRGGGAAGVTTSVRNGTLQQRYGFLHWEHPIFTANKDRWLENERLMYGGDLALEYLRPFEWEVADKDKPDSAYQWRQQLAVYPNLPDKFTTLVANHLMRSAPRYDQGLDFGALGKVSEDRANPTQAELVYFSCDHPGQQGTGWDEWWSRRLKMAMATGHRWIFVNAPPVRPRTRLEERFGRKPFLMEFSPLEVPNWYFNAAGDLEYAVVSIKDMNPRVEQNSFVVNEEDQEVGKLLLVRKGTTRLGAEFEQGGWWMFDADDDITDFVLGWKDTAGEIPFFPYIADSSKGVQGHPAMSRPTTTELGACALALMNITSAANFDAWDIAKGVEWLRGVDLDAWNLAMDKQKEGSRWLPLTPHAETDSVPEVTPSGAGTMSADIFTAREASLWNQAQWLGVQESVGTKSTAAGSNADFSASQMPRIMQMAMATMNAQNLAIFFLEQRFGHKKPKGQAIWPTRFNLVELQDRIKEFFEAERLSGLRCTPLDAEAMLQMAVEKGLVVSETDKEKFRAAFIKFGEMRDKAIENGGKEPGPSQDPGDAQKQSERLADDKKTDGSHGKPGRPAPEK